MQVIRGDYGGNSTAIGYLKLCRVIRRRERALKVAAQKERLYTALEITEEEVSIMRKNAIESVGEEHGEIYEIYLRILACEPLRIRILSEIESGASTEEAVRALLSDEGISAEGAFSRRHVRDCLDLLLKILEDIKCPDLREPPAEGEGGSYIYVSDGEGSGELISLLKRMTRENGFEPAGVVCATAGELKSAVSMELPSLLIAPDRIPDESFDGVTAILDCEKRRLILDPDLIELEKYSESGRELERRRAELDGLADLRSETPSGRRIRLCDERSPTPSSPAVLGATGADRGTLVLTDALPSTLSEDAQFELYKRLAESRAAATVRLFELSADGSLSGLRGAGLFSLFRQVYKTQLKALLRAAFHGSLSVLLPSVSRREELLALRSILCEAKNELRESSLPFSELTDLCIELSTPAAVLNSGELCGECELSVIDLDRLVSLTAAAELCDPIAADQLRCGIAPALGLCSRAITDSGAEFAVRGTLAADPRLTHALIDCGFKYFFLDPDRILSVKEMVLSHRESTDQ